MFRETKPGYLELVELFDELNKRYAPIKEIEEAVAKLFEEHRQSFKAELEEAGVEYERALDTWKGTYPYANAEYRDIEGRRVPEENAEKLRAKIWLWRSDNAAIPKGGGTDNKKGVHTFGDPDYRFYSPLHPKSKLPCPHPKSGWRFPEKPIGLSTSFQEMEADNRIVWGETEKNIPQVKRFLHEVDTAVARSVIADYTDGEKELTAISGKQRSFPNPKPTTLIGRFIEQTTEPKDWVMDFFAGSGTSGHAVLALEQSRRFVLTEMGGYFDAVTKPRIARLMFSPHWKNGSPGAAHRRRHIVKVQRFEQYEDVVNNLETAWDDAAIPTGVPLRYLYRPDQNAVRQSLNLAAPLANTIKAGQDGALQTVDLLETWALLQGYWVRSRRVLAQGDKRYDALETECGCLVLLRDIAEGEDDSAAVNAIAASYTNADGSPRIQRLELNQWADLRKIKLPCTLMTASDFDRGTSWN